jgi:glycosyltransferase involved in cell wall biosynthesis
MQEVFTSVGAFSFNSFSERCLVERIFQVAHIPSSVIGNAVNESRGDPAAARLALGLGADEDFVLCIGRVERSKGCASLMELWEMYTRRRPGAPRLVFVGPVHDHFDATPGVVLAGRQPEEVKWGALSASRFLISPSARESFSLVLLESWLAGSPVLVNARCGPTVEHCRRSGGGLWFHDYADFEAAVDRLLGDPELGDALARRGGRYARQTFSWPAIVERYEKLARQMFK